MLLNGDCRKILPVVPKTSRGMIVHMCLKSSIVLLELKVLDLTDNMRLKALKDDPRVKLTALEYPEFLLRVGEGRIEQDEDSNIDLPNSITVTQSSVDLIDSIFPNLFAKYSDTEWLTSKAIIATTTSTLKRLNKEVI